MMEDPWARVRDRAQNQLDVEVRALAEPGERLDEALNAGWIMPAHET